MARTGGLVMTSSDRTGATQPGGFSRRDLIVSAAAMGAASLAERPSIAADLPPRGEFIIRGADVVSMDPAVGDLRGDIHVRGGEIVAVAPDITAPGAAVIDARGMIALPGLIDSHNHIWNSTLRNLVREGPEKGYFPTVLALGKVYTPEDTYRGVRL